MFHKVVSAICANAGWKKPRIHGNVCSFHLEGGLSFSLSSPDGIRLMARAVLVSASGQKVHDDILDVALRLVTARFAHLRAVPFLDTETEDLALHAFTSLKAPPAESIRFTERFLNDLSFWKAQPALLPSSTGVAPAFRW